MKRIIRRIESFLYAVRYKMFIHRLLRCLSWTGVKVQLFLWIKESIDYSPQVRLNDNIEDYSFEFLRPDEIVNVSWLNTKKRVERKLEGGDKCLGVKYKGNIIGYTWAEPSKCSDFPFKSYLKSNEAYLSDMFVNSSFRGKNVAPYLRIECYKALKNVGYDTCYSISDYFNKPSIRFKEKLNARFVTLCVCVRLFKKFRWKWTLKEYENQK